MSDSSRQRETILTEAEGHIYGSRQQDYGHPIDNHARTGGLWSEYLRGKYEIEIELSQEDVCMLNLLQKIARGMHVITRDTLVDIAGFAANVEMVQDERERREKHES